MKVGQIMTQVVHTCHPEDTLEEAAKLMWDHDCGAAPVVDADSKLVGMITDRDICMAAYTQGRPLQDIRVQSAMAKKVYSVKAEAALFSAEKLMRENQIRRVPVVDDQGHVVGIVSLNDIALEAQRDREQGRRDVQLGEVVSTFAAVCRPRTFAPLVSTKGSVSLEGHGGPQSVMH